jgi:hypothetical protein
MMTAVEVTKAQKTALNTRPAVVRGVVQEALQEMTAECDVEIHGTVLRLPAGCIIAILGEDSRGTVAALLTEVDFVGRDGYIHHATPGMILFIPAA